MLKSISHELNSAEPAGYTDDAVSDVLLLHNAENDHASARLTVIILGFIDSVVFADASGPSVMSGFGVLLVFLQSF